LQGQRSADWGPARTGTRTACRVLFFRITLTYTNRTRIRSNGQRQRLKGVDVWTATTVTACSG
jgi:hypothetical protein